MSEDGVYTLAVMLGGQTNLSREGCVPALFYPWILLHDPCKSDSFSQFCLSLLSTTIFLML